MTNIEYLNTLSENTSAFINAGLNEKGFATCAEVLEYLSDKIGFCYDPEYAPTSHYEYGWARKENT